MNEWSVFYDCEIVSDAFVRLLACLSIKVGGREGPKGRKDGWMDE